MFRNIFTQKIRINPINFKWLAVRQLSQQVTTFNQIHLVAQMKRFLEKHQLNADIAKNLQTSKGECHGFTTLITSAKWFESQNLGISPKTMSLRKISKLLELLSHWNGETTFSTAEQEAIYDLIVTIHNTQRNQSGDGLADQLNKLNDCNHFQREYSITGQFCATDFNQVINNKGSKSQNIFANLLPPDKMLFVSSAQHIGSFLRFPSDATAYHYNANGPGLFYQFPVSIINQKPSALLQQLIFNNFWSQPLISPWKFEVIGTQPLATYPRQTQILTRLKNFEEPDDTNKVLEYAVEMNCLDSLAANLSNASVKNIYNAIYHACLWNRTECLQMLTDFVSTQFNDINRMGIIEYLITMGVNVEVLPELYSLNSISSQQRIIVFSNIIAYHYDLLNNPTFKPSSHSLHNFMIWLIKTNYVAEFYQAFLAVLNDGITRQGYLTTEQKIKLCKIALSSSAHDHQQPSDLLAEIFSATPNTNMFVNHLQRIRNKIYGTQYALENDMYRAMKVTLA